MRGQSSPRHTATFLPAFLRLGTSLHAFSLHSHRRGAGTDGEVFISMKGEWGAMGETQLENARDNFSRNKASAAGAKQERGEGP